MNFQRNVLNNENTAATTQHIQGVLAHLIDFSLQVKQAHWNVTGANFVPVHEQLDEVAEVYQEHIDTVAERLLALGTPEDGRLATVAAQSGLDAFPAGKVGTAQVCSIMADRLKALSEYLRYAQEGVADTDPVTEDMFIGIIHDVEKHLWMYQAQES